MSSVRTGRLGRDWEAFSPPGEKGTAEALGGHPLTEEEDGTLSFAGRPSWGD